MPGGPRHLPLAWLGPRDGALHGAGDSAVPCRPTLRRGRRPIRLLGMPTDDDGSRDDSMLGSNIVTVTHCRPDIDGLRAASTRIVLAVGASAEGEIVHRGGEAVAELL